MQVEYTQMKLYKHTMQGVITWVVELFILCWILFGGVQYLLTFKSTKNATAVIESWVAWTLLIAVIMTVTGVGAFSFTRRSFLISAFMAPVTQAFLCTVTIIFFEFAVASWKAIHQDKWAVAWFPVAHPNEWISIALGSSSLFVIWLVANFLHYSSLSYQKGSSSFLNVPTLVICILVFVLANEYATQGLVICTHSSTNILTYAYANLVIFTSALMHTMDVLDFDILNWALDSFKRAPILHYLMMLILFPAYVSKRTGVRTYRLIHGTLGLLTFLMYLQRLSLTITTFASAYALALLLLVVTIYSSSGIHDLLDKMFQSDEDVPTADFLTEPSATREETIDGSQTTEKTTTKQHRSHHHRKHHHNHHSSHQHHNHKQHDHQHQTTPSQEPLQQDSGRQVHFNVEPFFQDELEEDEKKLRDLKKTLPPPRKWGISPLAQFPNVPVLLRRTKGGT